jgi:4,5-dihydroxyphthalate decarboxylase
MRLTAMLGDYPVTRALKRGLVPSPHVSLDFADVKKPSTAFRRVVRELAFDVAELAIMTFLIARACGKPLVLLPAVLTARFQHPYLVYDPSRGALAPQDLAGRRVGIRSYSVTTATWIRGILADEYGVEPHRVKWISFEEPHVAEFREPPNVVRAPPGKDALGMLRAGEIDAAVLAEPLAPDSPLKTLIADPDAAAQAWHAKHRAVQINHMVVAKVSLLKTNPAAVREIFRMLEASRQASGLPAPGEIDMNPFGIEANRRNLEVAIDCIYRQKLIPRRFAVDELFDDATRISS